MSANPCQRCGTYVLGNPEKCPGCAHDFDGRPRLGSMERPHDCRKPEEIRTPAPKPVSGGGDSRGSNGTSSWSYAVWLLLGAVIGHVIVWTLGIGQ